MSTKTRPQSFADFGKGADREFYLKSLDDLEREFADGNIDTDSYHRLKSDYTARAAEALRRPIGDSRAPKARSRKLLLGGAASVAVVAGLVLSQSVGTRVDGEQVTGRDVATVDDQRQQLEEAATSNPDDFNANIRLARYYEANEEPALAFKHFRIASTLNPEDAESRTHAGWILVLSGQTAEGAALLTESTVIDPEYVDARFFLGFTKWRFQNDPDGATSELQRAITLAPESVVADSARQLLAEIEQSR